MITGIIIRIGAGIISGGGFGKLWMLSDTVFDAGPASGGGVGRVMGLCLTGWDQELHGIRYAVDFELGGYSAE